SPPPPPAENPASSSPPSLYRTSSPATRDEERSGSARERRPELAGAWRHGAIHLEQAHHRRLSGWRVAAARGAGALSRDGCGRRRDRASDERHLAAARRVV